MWLVQSDSAKAMISCQRHLFDIPPDITYLNCAYMSPLMRPALDAGTSGLARKTHPWELTASDFFSDAEEFRTISAKLFGASADDVAVVSSAGYAIDTAARNLPVHKGQKILVLDEQFPSNFYPWQELARATGAMLKIVPWPHDNGWTAAVLEALTSDTAVAALPHIHWTSCGRLDLDRIGAACRRIGAALVLDLTQSLGALSFDIKEVQPDFAVAATYKWLLGPYSLGAFYVAPKWQSGDPLEHGWVQRANARDFSRLIQYSDQYDSRARRFDMGERSNFALLPAGIHAMRQILEWGVEEISATLGAMNRRLAQAAAEQGFLAADEPLRVPHYLCLRRAKAIPPEITHVLAREKVYISVRGSSLRITPHVYNTAEDCDRLIGCLRQISD